MKNKGQVLVIFVILIPIIILLLASTIDIGLMYMETNKLNNINKYALNYGLDNINEKDVNIKINNLIEEHDKNIIISKLNIKDNQISLNLNKKINSIFGQIIGFKTYNIESSYKGINRENKKEIIKG